MTPETLRWIASIGTMAAGLVLASRVRPTLMGWAFVPLTFGSMVWVYVGYSTEEYALMVQNGVLTLINIFGVYRWLIWKKHRRAGDLRALKNRRPADDVEVGERHDPAARGKRADYRSVSRTGFPDVSDQRLPVLGRVECRLVVEEANASRKHQPFLDRTDLVRWDVVGDAPEKAEKINQSYLCRVLRLTIGRERPEA